MSAEELEKLVKQHVAQLREHVDVVRIFVSLDPEEGQSTTRHCDSGSGNIFAQLGHVKDWIVGMDELTREQAREKEE
jgi:hypothetical protein